jgi:ketosteroid isomerase-like protein
MKKVTFIALAMMAGTCYAQSSNEISDKIIALEKAALDRWCNGDVYGFLELSAEDVVYFDPMLDKRLEGLQNLTEYYKPLQGKIKASNYELIAPKVQAVDNMAVLTFNFKSSVGENTYSWNCTEVYSKEKDGNWKIIQTHWSLTKPNLK